MILLRMIKNFSRRWLVVVGCCLMPLVVIAQPASYHSDGYELLARCQQAIKMLYNKPYQKEDVDWCLGFIQGVLNSHIVYSYYLTGKKTQFDRSLADDKLRQEIRKNQFYCIPQQVTLGKIIEDVTVYLGKHNHELHYDASFLIHKALYHEYPCLGPAK